MADEPQVVGRVDVQVLLQNLAEAQRGILEERRNSIRALAEERERTRTQLERQKRDHDERVRTVEKENEALARAYGRAQNEIDTLRLENAVLKNGNGHKSVTNLLPQVPEAEAHSAAGVPVKQAAWKPSKTEALPPPPASGPVSQAGFPLKQLPEVTVVPPPGPSLGKSLPMRPEGSENV